MPVKWLLYWQPNHGGQAGSQILQDVVKGLESINGVRTGRWQVVASQYRPNQRDPAVPLGECARELLGLTFSDAPTKQFFVLRAERMVVEAASTMQQIMENVQLYRNRFTIFFQKEVYRTEFFQMLSRSGDHSVFGMIDNGYQYQLGDFQIKAGRVTLAQMEVMRGIVMEIEYSPVSSLDQTRLLLQEFVNLWQEVVTSQSMAGRFMKVPDPNFSEYGLSDHYSWQHTSLQYVAAMVHFTSSRTNP